MQVEMDFYLKKAVGKVLFIAAAKRLCCCAHRRGPFLRCSMSSERCRTVCSPLPPTEPPLLGGRLNAFDTLHALPVHQHPLEDPPTT